MSNEFSLDPEIYLEDPTLYGKQIESMPIPEPSVGIDTKGAFIDHILDAESTRSMDLSTIESFTQLSNNRELLMELLDTMAEDSIIAAALEIYAEDATERNPQGDIVWCTSSDDETASYVTYLLKALNINKNVYKWVYSLCKYGDVYLRLYRQSEYENDDDLFEGTKKDILNEDIIVKMFSKNDPLVHYIEMVPNPAEMFELTRYGKSYGYIKAPTITKVKADTDLLTTGTYRYSFNTKDVEIYPAINFVHASLEDNLSRFPEQVELFKTQAGDGTVYTVKRGQSLLYNVFKIWRELSLLENSLILNRLTKSAIVRIIGIEIGDMPKNNVPQYLMRVKQLFEQKVALNKDNSMQEYTNPGPMENIVYIPTRNGKGSISTQQVGGDVDVGGIVDIDYFKNRLYGSLRIPKTFIGDTDDAAGFNGGSSLALISSRYAKAIKRIQSTMIQAITDLINLILIDRKQLNRVNQFTIHMQTPTTQEEQDRVQAENSKINMIQDILNILDASGMTDESAKLKIVKELFGSTLSNSDVLKVIQEEIDEYEKQKEKGLENPDEDTDDVNIDSEININAPRPNNGGDNLTPPMVNIPEQPQEVEDETILPLPADLGIGDLTDLNNDQI